MYRQLDKRVPDKEVCLSWINKAFIGIFRSWNCFLFSVSHFARGQALVLRTKSICILTTAYLSVTIYHMGRSR